MFSQLLNLYPLALLCTTALFAGSASGAAIELRAGPGGIGAQAKCDISAAKTIPSLPAPLTQPTGTPSFIGLGVGTQNYTCSAAGTYAAAGAVATLFDVSCLYKNKAIFSKIPDLAMAAWSRAPRSITPESMVKALESLCAPAVLGQHYFITNPLTGQGTNPIWDFRNNKAFKGNPDAFVVAAKVSGAPAPTTARDIDWLQLASIQGGLAGEVYRTDTREGRSPASCTAGSAPIQVKYVSLYWMYGGSVKV